MNKNSYLSKIACKLNYVLLLVYFVSFTLVMRPVWSQGKQITVPLYAVYEITFTGPSYSLTGNPVSEVELITQWKHENGKEQYKIFGFWDGNGKGGAGNLFKVRFCPTLPGKWALVKTVSNKKELQGESQGLTITCISSDHKGFWEVDDKSAGKRWFKRSNGAYAYIYGNTMYSFLSEYYKGKPHGNTIARDVKENGAYLNKLRFGITGDLYPNPTEKPFLDKAGNPTDNGNFSHRPNPKWFFERVDLAVQEAYAGDQIADIILNGPDVPDSRSVLAAGENGGDNTPVLRYMAARYGSYPNVWMCLTNEFDIKKPVYSSNDIIRFGNRLKSFLPYPTPVSVHANQRDWYHELNTDKAWNSHVIIQNKIKKLYTATDILEKNYWIGRNKPVINDELAYEGEGDGWSEEDVVESHLGAFLGGGYGSTGFKSGNKEGQYFAGNFNPADHKALDNLLWLRSKIDSNITFWQMSPDFYASTGNNSTSIFRNISDRFRAMSWHNNEYVLGTNEAKAGIEVRLPSGTWQITQYDVINKEEKIISTNAVERYKFDAPSSRAVLFHFKKVSK